ncbi:hypothetical protein Nepgr_003201 [Nepenthes gracilis]|uniref:Uncharacterized protein n=1 Tax=Nepenthes gracilis TaxID=150966 RepID=A0AAD3XD62_NEPGR|nr:hypothetical protein Nepgr_003201 [Nepenthes gracilis]
MTTKKNSLSMAVAFVLLCSLLIHSATQAVRASARLRFTVEPQDIKPPLFVIVTGCNNDCDTACCNCVVEKQPPVCVQCCGEEP